jgi:cytochrome b561
VWRNTENSYGLIAVILHWSMAIAIVGIFLLGLWMVDLTYYDPWYKPAPDLHKGIGVLLFAVLLIRLAWRWANPKPRLGASLTAVERLAASFAHIGFYVLLIGVMLSGYLISTADGRPIDVFGLFQVPATISGIPNQADLAGDVHFALAVAVIALACFHAAGAIKHHFVDRDRTLLRMLGRGGDTNPS